MEIDNSKLTALLQEDEDYIGHEITDNKVKIFVKTKEAQLQMEEGLKRKSVEFIAVLPTRRK